MIRVSVGKYAKRNTLLEYYNSEATIFQRFSSAFFCVIYHYTEKEQVTATVSAVTCSLCLFSFSIPALCQDISQRSQRLSFTIPKGCGIDIMCNIP